MYKKAAVVTTIFMAVLAMCSCGTLPSSTTPSAGASNTAPSAAQSAAGTSLSSSDANTSHSTSDSGLSIELSAADESTEAPDTDASPSSTEPDFKHAFEAASDDLIKSWSSGEMDDGINHALATPEITSVASQDNQITVTWQAVQGASKYDVSWGRADTLTTDPSFTFPSDESTWPNDTVGQDPVQLHICAMNEQGDESAFADVKIHLYTGKITFAFYDYDNKDVKVGETEAGTTLPCGVQTLYVDGHTINVGPLQLAQEPDGWSFRGSFIFETKPIQTDQDNTVSVFVEKTNP